MAFGDDDRVLQEHLAFVQLARQRERDQQQREQFAVSQETNRLQLEQLRRQVAGEAAATSPEAQTFGPSRGDPASIQERLARQAANQELLQAQAALSQQAETGTNAIYAQDAQQDLADIEPLVRRGVLGAGDVRTVVRSAALGGITDQRNSRKAQRELQAIMRQTQDGTFNEKQAAGAMQSLEKEYGKLKLLTVPGYAEAVGLGEQMRAARELEKFETAERLGVEPDLLTYDSDTGELVPDPTFIKIKQYKMLTEEHEVEKADKLTTARRKNIEVQVNAVAAQIRSTNTLFSATKDPAYVNVLNKLTIEQHKLLRELGGAGKEDIAAPSAPSLAATSKQYQSRDEFLNALKTGQHKVGEPGFVAGVPYKANADGTIKRVN